MKEVVQEPLLLEGQCSVTLLFAWLHGHGPRPSGNSITRETSCQRVSLHDLCAQYPTVRATSSLVKVLRCPKLHFQHIYLLAVDPGASQILSLTAVYQTFSPRQEEPG